MDIYTEAGLFRASVPSGASTGAYEAVELADGGDMYVRKGVLTAVKMSMIVLDLLFLILKTLVEITLFTVRENFGGRSCTGECIL